MDDLDARVGLRVFREHAPDMSLGGTVIGNAEFPPIVGLGAYAFNRLPKKLFRGIICGHNEGDEGAVRKELRKPLHFRNIERRYDVVGLNPLLVTGRRLCLSPLIGTVSQIVCEW